MTPFEAEADLVWDYGGGHFFLLSGKPLRNILKPRLIFSAAQQGARRVQGSIFGFVWVVSSLFSYDAVHNNFV